MDYATPISPGASRTFRNFEPYAYTSLAIGAPAIHEKGSPWSYTTVQLERGRTELVVTGDEHYATLRLTGAVTNELTFGPDSR